VSGEATKGDDLGAHRDFLAEDAHDRFALDQSTPQRSCGLEADDHHR
jgi:hypothetical protein